jgi:DNA-binding transcriptional MerR regulator
MKAPSFTIGQLAKQAGLSRSTLLYYDSIGLLKPSGRTRANYRRYTDDDARRLEKIRLYRQMGLSTDAVGKLLAAPHGGIRDILEKRLSELGREIGRLREQQQVIVRMLKSNPRRGRVPFLGKDDWVAMFKSAGLDEEGMQRWHREFEKLSPASHQEFLEGLGIPAEEIALIRKSSQV